VPRTETLLAIRDRSRKPGGRHQNNTPPARRRTVPPVHASRFPETRLGNPDTGAASAVNIAIRDATANGEGTPRAATGRVASDAFGWMDAVTKGSRRR